MKKLLLATTCLALSSVAVMAADLPLQTKAPLMAAPVFSWTGCYVGAQRRWRRQHGHEPAER